MLLQRLRLRDSLVPGVLYGIMCSLSHYLSVTLIGSRCFELGAFSLHKGSDAAEQGRGLICWMH